MGNLAGEPVEIGVVVLEKDRPVLDLSPDERNLLRFAEPASGAG